jgi:sulfate transport system substrate-binding protein
MNPEIGVRARGLLVLLPFLFLGCRMGDTGSLLNVSYDPTRELYRQFNDAFSQHWFAETGETVLFDQSHGGSGSQARGVIDGLPADVVTLALASDVDAIAAAGMIPAEWQSRLPANSAPYASTLIFLVRKGNPKNIRDWDDLARADVAVITPNPKTSGAARWNYLAMWGFALRRELGPEWIAKLGDPSLAGEVAAAQEAALAFVGTIFGNVPVLDSAARGATNTFLQNGVGDVLINWENEILLSSAELATANVEMVIPPMSILAEPVVAVVDRVVDRRGTREVAEAYLEDLYSKAGQEIAAQNYYRPNASVEVIERYRDQFPEIELFTIDAVFGGWSQAHPTHFADGGTFDRIYDVRR